MEAVDTLKEDLLASERVYEHVGDRVQPRGQDLDCDTG